MTYCIETQNLTKRYPVLKRYRELLLDFFKKKEVTALKNVTFHVKKGELFGVLGANGAGKTTLLKILCTLVLPSSGSAYINGLEVTKNQKEIRKLIGYVVGDERSFYWRLTGKQNLKFFAKLNNLSDREAEQRIDKLAETMQIKQFENKLFKDYSTGMRQRLAIARGLLTNPEVIFMDEPTNGLDPHAAQNLRTFIKEKVIERDRKTVIFTTHNLHEAEELCNRFAFINHGEIKTIGTVEEIRKRFSSNKKYIIETDDHGFSIHKSCIAEKVVSKIISGYPDSERVTIEIITETGKDDNTEIIKTIVEKGGKIYSIREKNISLSELFSKIIEKTN